MRNLHKLTILSGGLILCVILFIYIFSMERVEIRTIEIRDHLFTANRLLALADTLQFVNTRSNTTSGVDKDALLQHLSERYGPVSFVSIHPRNTDLTPEEQNRAARCLKNAVSDRDKNGSRFWGKEEHIRTTHHTYLKNKDVVMIEIGGNRGDDATEFVKLYNPRYIILEPLENYFNILKEKFKNNSRVTVVNVGLGIKNEVAMVSIEGVNACATSKFSGANGKTLLYITNATKFLMNLGVGLFDVDLLTTNCEGCEYEVLETILSTNLINYIKNIQFATHSTLKGLKDPLGRYCKFQELLQRTHTPTYQYRFIWESWRRNDLL
ncbi:hypothetical protein CHS0354_008404 [Potamilus streckersoni]|uniref:Methyltransferase FkbM domain-containing protein n=1 Tax=Potamilus streckersoni TaxID=2493646 RepID=A0AAE0RPU1_9BIVA|nr:hypothetical protein CHS0354_008404 [Potamilus streckersoni]